MSSRAEHHADSPESQVRTAKDQIAWLLQRRNSREHAISSKGLAQATGWPNGGIKPTTVRDCIKEIRQERKLPIVSCSQGYYLINSAQELEWELERIQEEIATREETKQELAQAFNHTKYSDRNE